MSAFERTRALIAAALVIVAVGNPAEARHRHHHRAAAPAAVAPSGDLAVLRARLPNGLRVIIVRNTLAPVVATSVNYLVGSDDTPAGFPGSAHALEHMMFRGSPGLSADQLANIGALMGGDFNANTRGSLTQYLYTVPAEDVDVALNIEALRMKGLDSTEAEWAKERGAIEQEVAQDQSAPGYKLYERLRSELFAGTPYEHDALGTRPSFEKTSGADLKAFHAKWYAPNNAILVLVGNVDPKATLAKIKTLFGAIPSRALPARAKFAFKPVKPAIFTIDSDYPNYTRVIAMRFPGLKSKDFPALEVLADVLSSRRFELYGLVAAGKALGTEFSLEPQEKASIAYAAVSYAPGADGNALEARVREILEKVARDGVPADLVEAAKLQERRSSELQKNSIADLASVWSDAVALYGLKSPDEDLKRIEKVTVEDVNRVAREYLKLDASISGLLLPKGSGKPVASSTPTGGMETINLGEAKPVPLPDWANAAMNRLDVPETTLAPVDTVLPNGLRLIVQPTKVSDTVNVYGHIRNRAETQMPPGKDGVNILLGSLFNFGTEKLDRLAFEKELDAIGAQERGGADFSLHVLAQDFDRGVELLAQHQLQPALPQEALTAILPQIAQSVESRNHTPGYLAQRAMVEALFAPDDPSRREATGATVIGLKRADVLAYYKTVFRPDMTTIVVIGNVTPEKAKEVIAKHFGAWTAEGPKPPVDLPVPPANKPAQVAVPDDSRVQDSVLLAQNLAPKRTDADYYALSLGNEVLGGGFYSTRLSIDLRKNAGLVYSVGSSLQSGRTRGNYFVQYACDPENVTKAAAIVVQNLKTMQEKPVPQEELDRVKAMVLRQLPLGEASVDDIARGFLDRTEYDLPLDEPTLAAKKYVATTAAEVQAAFAKWIRPNDLVRITQGPAPK
ncbi:M16 family metallopeptidase [Rhizomicrobium electricum]|uniref:Pitrilysin family protein n=1 Tax=Rhizomicrobium electricum TaxID=480070 RepID=A0ABN1ETP2_9PROT|nr:pitrilysin family protein [Rhizomicrobium electricum]NIJ49699.1 zinc protease [Rhizomicrobium electricum]